MASSYSNQIPAIIHVAQKLAPKNILDIGKGFGKYGFLLHEYIGVDNTRRIDPAISIKEQSNITIDAVEVDPDLMLPHLQQFYSNVHFGDILTMYRNFSGYDLVLMIDIIEHIPKEEAIVILKHFVTSNACVIVSTPIDFFEQYLYESVYENHVSHWTKADFAAVGYVDFQYFGEGAVYLVSKEKLDIIGFGNSPIKKAKRLARLLKDDIRSLFK